MIKQMISLLVLSKSKIKYQMKKVWSPRWYLYSVPHAEFLAKLNAVRYAFLELGVDEGVIVARTDSLGAVFTARIAITKEVGDLGDQYNSFLDNEEVKENDMNHGDVMINQHGKLVRPKRRLPSKI